MTKAAKMLLEQAPSGYPRNNRTFAEAAKKVVERRASVVERVTRYRAAMEQEMRARATSKKGE